MKWKSPDRWEEIKNGVNCPMCQDLHLEENPFSFFVTELKQTYVRLPKNQYMKGWTIVALKRHANELFELTEKELLEFWQDVSIVAKALDKIYKPTKINYCIFGHHCPHLHCHLLVHSYEDDPSTAIKMDLKEVFLTASEYQSMIKELKTKIDTVKIKS
jgi:diadenosine tetraphosphate (Ap4A) HIT family hydrolase